MLERRHGRRFGLIALAFAMLLAGCGEDAPPKQTTLTTPTLAGTAAYDDRVTAGPVTAKGTAGLPRTASNSSGTNRYSVDLSQLTGPYALRWIGPDANDQQVFLYSVATQAGTANVTPLTTLLFAQLMGQDPTAAYAAFGANGTEMVTDEKIRAAQAKVTAYLRDVLGVSVRSGDASFITSAFNATSGDPMFDTIQALEAVLVTNGSTLATLSRQVASLARLCIEENVVIDIAGVSREFCPATKTANREEDDNSVIDYVFSAPTNDTLTVRVRGDEILSADYVNAGLTYSCSGSACGGVILGVAASDQTRSLTFTSATLTGTSEGAVLNGVLRGAIPGVELPVLPCSTNKFFVVLADNTVIAQCVDAFDPLNIGGTLNTSRGATPSRAVYAFADTSGADPAYPQVELVTDGNDSVVSVYFFQYDPATLIPTVRFACEAEACNGITLGPVTVNTDLGPDMPVLVRNVSFANTTLSGMTESGAPTGTTATLKASFTTVYFVDPNTPLVFPALAGCDPASDTVAIDVLSGPFNFCSAEANRTTSVLDNGDQKLEMFDDQSFAPIEVILRAGAVVSVTYSSPVSQAFRCDADCDGVSVSLPDTLGHRTVTFAGTVLHEVQSFPRPGTRTTTLNGGPLVFPPVIP
ncbi:hypothetical protein [Peristeroidobacter soli]|uniref:hypothetical protein n=1 Tax=Peristeroidobacter soli TaxID=2497877 RepID=UPI00101D3ED1|nr:hypothetical protein [Peristeroidobacter soli]